MGWIWKKVLDNKYCIYILKCADNSLYTGITVDFDRRLEQHSSGKGAKYTTKRLPVELVIKTEYLYNRSEASKIEYKIKHTKKADKVGKLKCYVLNV